MNIPKHLWRRRGLSHVLPLFARDFGVVLQDASPAMVVRAQQFLPFILWRWYFMRLEQDMSMTPYTHLEWCRVKEGWPKEGQFLLSADIVPFSGNLDIHLATNYISFDEQPLIIDVKNMLAGKPLTYSFVDHTYQHHVTHMANRLREQRISIDNVPSQAEWMVRAYFEYTLMSWYQQDDVVQRAFTQFSWISFWEKMLAEAGKPYGGYTTIHLDDDFTAAIRRVIPHWGLTNAEIRAGRAKHADENALQALHLWQSANACVFVPLSLYLNCISLVFGERDNFPEDVEWLLSEYQEEPSRLYSPCSWVSLTSFGRRVFG